MKRKLTVLSLALCVILAAVVVTMAAPRKSTKKHRSKSKTTKVVKTKPRGEVIVPTDTLLYTINEKGDTIRLTIEPALRSGRLTEQDYEEVAAELGVEVAAIKAVVEVEAGKTGGFWADHKPLINFDLSVFRRMAAKNKVSLSAAARTHPVIFAAPNAAKYGSRHAAQQARLDAAREVDNLSGIEGTFWGMFQIGGFHWQKCGAASPDQFVELMSRSERDQLEMFAKFIKASGMLKHLQNKNWAAFARVYNGPSYARRGYHSKMAAAYAKYKK